MQLDAPVDVAKVEMELGEIADRYLDAFDVARMHRLGHALALTNEGASLVATRGHLMDSVGLGVSDLDAWVAKLKAENVTFLRQPFKIGDTRAVMIEGPSHEALELVEVK